MKTLKLFLEDFKKDEQELQTGKRISNPDLAHSLALTTCSFEFECYLNIKTALEYVSASDERMKKGPLLYYTLVQKLIKRYFKTQNVLMSTKYHGIKTATKIASPDHWFVENDTSLTSHFIHEGYFSVEIISPWVPAKDAEAFIKKFKEEIFDRLGGKTDHSTGFHVNLKTKNAVANPVKLLVLLDQKAELKTFNRTEVSHTKEINTKVLFDFVNQLETHYDISNPEVMESLVKRLISLLPDDKYRSINVKDYNFNKGTGRLEFRIIGNDYLGSLFEKTLESVNRFIMLMASATDDNAHIKEVATKYKKVIKTKAEINPEEVIKYAKKNKTRLDTKTETALLKQANVEMILEYVQFLKTIGIVWKKAEDVIAKDARASLHYAVSIIEKPFPKGEEAISKESNIAYQYTNQVLHKPFPKGEEAISQNPWTSYLYAIKILEARFFKGEDAIKNSRWWKDYTNKFIKDEE